MTRSIAIGFVTASLALGALVLPAGVPRAESQAAHPSAGAAEPAHRVQIGNPAIGRELFKQKGCASCHAIKGQGGQVGPDLSRIQHVHNIYSMAALMWNHAPHMEQVMKDKGITRPEFKGDEMADLMAYLHSLEVVGDPDRGKQVFASKGCVQCHAVRGEGGKIGPDLGRIAHPHPPIELVGVMWNHSPTMTAIMQGMGMQRPIFEGNEMADLLAYIQQVQGGAAPAQTPGGRPGRGGATPAPAPPPGGGHGH